MKQAISVIVPCYNGEKYLREALDSIESQGWEFEIIFIDDGSTDNSKKIVETEYPHIKYHFKENSSAAGARNKGIPLASHDFIAFLDADDIWIPNKTKLQMEVFRKNPELDVVGGLMDYIIMPESKYRAHLYSSEPIEHTLLATLIVKRSVFDQIGMFDESLKLGEDLDWFLKLRESTLTYEVIDSVVFHYRIHEQGITARKSFKGLGTMDVIRKALERKRITKK